MKKIGESIISHMGGTPYSSFSDTVKRVNVLERDVNTLKYGLVMAGALGGLAVANSIRAAVIARKNGGELSKEEGSNITHLPKTPPKKEEEKGGEV